MINMPSGWNDLESGDTITFSGSATDTQDGLLQASALNWQLIMHHCPSNCHEHSHPRVHGRCWWLFRRS